MLEVGIAEGQTVDYALLIGVWSKPGQCDRVRVEFTASGRYVWTERSGRTWEVKTDELYWPLTDLRLKRPVRGMIAVAPVRQTEEILMEVHKLDRRELHGKWVTMEEGPVTLTFANPSDAWFKFVRCPSKPR